MFKAVLYTFGKGAIKIYQQGAYPQEVYVRVVIICQQITITLSTKELTGYSPIKQRQTFWLEYIRELIRLFVVEG